MLAVSLVHLLDGSPKVRVKVSIVGLVIAKSVEAQTFPNA